MPRRVLLVLVLLVGCSGPSTATPAGGWDNYFRCSSGSDNDCPAEAPRCIERVCRTVGTPPPTPPGTDGATPPPPPGTDGATPPPLPPPPPGDGGTPPPPPPPERCEGGFVAVSPLGMGACVVCGNGAVLCSQDTSTCRLIPEVSANVEAPVLECTDYAGTRACCAVDSAASIQCWHDVGGPTRIAMPTGARALGLWKNHGCAVAADGGVWCWEDDGPGEHQSDLTSAATDVAIGEGFPGLPFFCAATSAGVACWGDNSFGSAAPAAQCSGRETSCPISTPTLVAGVTADVVTAGGGFACALDRASGAVECWGSNHGGALGRGLFDDPPNANDGMHESAAPIDFGSRVDQIDAAQSGDATGEACVLASGSVHCWGYTRYVGLGPMAGSEPQLVDVISDATQVAVGETGFCATTSSAVRCWNYVGAERDVMAGCRDRGLVD